MCGIIFKKIEEVPIRRPEDAHSTPPSPPEGFTQTAPNLAILAFLTVPIAAGALATLALLGVSSDSGAMLCLVPIAAAAIVVIACRLAIAPVAVTFLGLALIIAASVAGRPVIPEGVDPMEAAHLPGGFTRLGMPLMWIVFLASGLVWSAREAFVRDWERDRIAEWTLSGLRNLLKPDAGARWRVLCGLGVVLGFPLVVTLFFPENLRRSIITTSMRAPMKALMMLGIGLLASGLRLK